MQAWRTTPKDNAYLGTRAECNLERGASATTTCRAATAEIERYKHNVNQCNVTSQTFSLTCDGTSEMGHTWKHMEKRFDSKVNQQWNTLSANGLRKLSTNLGQSSAITVQFILPSSGAVASASLQTAMVRHNKVVVQMYGISWHRRSARMFHDFIIQKTSCR